MSAFSAGAVGPDAPDQYVVYTGRLRGLGNSSTEVPPNFITTVPTRGSSSAATAGTLS